MLRQEIAAFADALLDFIFPRICCGCEQRVLEGGLICSTCLEGAPRLAQPICSTCGCPDAEFKSEGRCTDCPAGKVYFEWARGTMPFEGIGKTIVERLKYHGREEYARIMAGRMFLLLEHEFPGVQVDRVIPVPLHRTRQRERGFNQSAILAECLGHYIRVPSTPDLLRRHIATPSQTRLTRTQRAKNIRGAFSCVGGSAAGERLLLVDDVYTTGATLNECARLLMLEAGALQVYCLSFARATLT